MSSEAMEPFERLQKRIVETNEAIGLHFMDWAILPGQAGEPPRTQIIFTVGPEAFQSREERDMDRTFEEIALEEKRLAREEKSRQIIEENLKVTNKGIFPEDDTPGA